MRLMSIDSFRAEARANRSPEGGIFKVSTIKPKSLDDDTRRMRFCFSDETIDRMGDVIAVDGWDLTDFNRNPVCLFAHDSSQPPIGKASDVGPEGSRLMGTIEFAPPETYAFADTVYRLLLGGFLNSVSVGFLPTEFSFVDNDPDRGFGIDFKRQQLLEISVVPVPANANALIDARAKGIDTRPLVEWAERALEGGGKVILPRAELEALRKAAKEQPMARRPGTRRRADDDQKPDDEEDKAPGGATCGRKAAEECGLKNASECAIHGKGTKADDDGDDDKPDENEKRFRRLERKIDRLMGIMSATTKADDDDNNDGDPNDMPMEHHDALRMAHRCLRAAKAFHTEGMVHHSKAMSLLDDVVNSLDGDSEEEDKDEEDGDGDKEPDRDPDDSDEKAVRLAKAEARRRRIAAV